MALEQVEFGKIDVMSPLFGGALVVPSTFWEPGSLSAHKGHFGIGATALISSAALSVGPSVTSPLSINSIGLNNHIGIYNVTGAHIKIGSNLSLGALDSTVTAISNKLSALFAKITPKILEVTPASSNAAAIGSLNGVWTFNGLLISVEPDLTGSDIRLKKNIRRLEDSDCLARLMKLNPVSYEWKEDKLPTSFLNEHRDENEMLKREMGFIAQEVEKYIPEVTGTKKFNDIPYKSIRYGKLAALIVGAVQEQQKEIDSLKTRIEALEGS